MLLPQPVRPQIPTSFPPVKFPEKSCRAGGSCGAYLKDVTRQRKREREREREHAPRETTAVTQEVHRLEMPPLLTKVDKSWSAADVRRRCALGNENRPSTAAVVVVAAAAEAAFVGRAVGIGSDVQGGLARRHLL